MKENFHHIGLTKLCGWLGIIWQAYYQESWKQIDKGVETAMLLKEVLRIRKDHKQIGTRKLY